MRIIRSSEYDMLPMKLEQPPRSEGVHLSDILKEYRELTIKKSPQKWPPLLMQLGFVWENLLAMSFKNLAGIRPGEIQYEGIALSPDGLLETTIGDGTALYRTVAEHKFTFKSSKSSVVENEMWMLQAMAYCKATSCQHALFNVLHIVGDYSRPFKPQFISTLVEFSDIDLNDNMMLVRSIRDSIMKRKEKTNDQTE